LSGEVTRFVGEREKPTALKQETIQEESRSSLSRNSYPLPWISRKIIYGLLRGNWSVTPFE